MTLTELLTDLESKPDLLKVSTPALRQEQDNVKLYHVPIVRLLRDNIASRGTQQVIVLNEGTSNEVAYYNQSKNFTETEERAPLHTDAEYISGLESKFTGWKVLKLSVRIEGDMDILNVRASNGTNVVEKRVGVWKNDSNQTQWKMFE